MFHIVVFGHESTTDRPIFVKFCTTTIITVDCYKLQTLKILNGGRPPS